MKRVLIDFDGVVYNNKAVFRHIKHRSNCYVSDRLNVPYTDALHLNTRNYLKYGHTVFATHTSVTDYNDFVFDVEMLDRVLYNRYEESDTFRLRRLKRVKEEEGLDLILCTNAPFRYCERILDLSGFAMADMFSPTLCFTSDKVNHVKPSDAFFTHVQSGLATHLDQNSDQTETTGQIPFYDDSSLNVLAATQTSTSLRSILFDPRDDSFEALKLKR